MNCNYFGKCGSCNNYEGGYEAQLQRKALHVKDKFKRFYSDEIEIFSSNEQAFRYRSEFKIWHDGDEIHYAMNTVDKKGHIFIEECPIVSESIANIMPKLLKEIKEKKIGFKLFGAEFLSNSTNDVLVTLLYHRKLDDEFKTEALKIQDALHVKIIGRARKQKVVLSEDYLIETLHVNDEVYRFKYIENSFTQPNLRVNESMISWSLNCCNNLSGDLLELYCGAGNFTIPFSKKFDKILATEISKSSIKAALYNCEINSISNIDFVRMSAQEFTSAIDGEREFVRMRDIDLKSYKLDTLFVDPPRSGIGDEGVKFASRFQNIIYISCNPDTLYEDIELLADNYEVVEMAIFDQFAYTKHLEMGVKLQKKD